MKLHLFTWTETWLQWTPSWYIHATTPLLQGGEGIENMGILNPGGQKQPGDGHMAGNVMFTWIWIHLLLLNGWSPGNIHDSNVSHYLIDSVRDFQYVLADSTYNSSEIYDYIFEITHSMPVIDTNRRRGIILEKLIMNRYIGFEIRKNHWGMYSLRLEIGGHSQYWRKYWDQRTSGMLGTGTMIQLWV